MGKVNVLRTVEPSSGGFRIQCGRIQKRKSGKENNVVLKQERMTKPRKCGFATSGWTPPSSKLNRESFTELTEVGRGGFSIVYRASLPAKGITCILKFISLEKLIKLNANINDVHLEQWLHRKLSHINIPKLIGYFETRASSVLVMEYCDRGDLHDYIHRDTEGISFPRTFMRNQDYLRQLVTAVTYFQSTTKYIHMDIKPENILVTSQDIIKLTDFGCCIEMKTPRCVHKNHNGGTKSYRPPEMLRVESKHFDSTADVWSIGCVAFQLMERNGEHPFFPLTHSSSITSPILTQALSLMTNFKNGTYSLWNFNSMETDVKTFLRQTIGAEREKRPLVSKLLGTAFLTNFRS